MWEECPILCVMSTKQRGIHSYRWYGNSEGREHIHRHILYTHTHIHTQNSVRGFVRGERGVVMCFVSRSSGIFP